MQRCDLSFLKKKKIQRNKPKTQLDFLSSSAYFLCSLLAQNLQKGVPILPAPILLFQFFLELPPIRLPPPAHYQTACGRRWPPCKEALVHAWLFLSVTLTPALIFLDFHTPHSLGYFLPRWWLPLGRLCGCLLTSLNSNDSSAPRRRAQAASFSIFTHILGDFMELHTLNFPLYAYDSQIFISNLDISQVLPLTSQHWNVLSFFFHSNLLFLCCFQLSKWWLWFPRGAHKNLEPRIHTEQLLPPSWRRYF